MVATKNKVTIIPREFGSWYRLLGGTVNEYRRRLQVLNAHQIQMREH